MVGDNPSNRLEALLVLSILLRLSERTKREVARYVENYKTVLALCEGTNTLTQIASRCRKDKGNLSRLLQRLEDLGLIYVAKIKGREKYYKLTLPLEILEEGLTSD